MVWNKHGEDGDSLLQEASLGWWIEPAVMLSFWILGLRPGSDK
jgi:hypothetical protein